MPRYSETFIMDDRYWTHDPDKSAREVERYFREVERYFREADNNEAWGEDEPAQDRLPPRVHESILNRYTTQL